MFAGRKRSSGLIGVDISSSAVKMVELDGSEDSPGVKSYAVQSLPQGAYAEGNIARIEDVTDAVENCLRRCASSAGYAAVALPATAVTTKRFVVPSGLPDDELEVRVEAEANQHIPFPLEDVNLDYQVVAEGDEVTDVLIIAAKRERIDDQVAAVETCGLKVKVVDVESYALINTMRLFAEDYPAGPDSVVAMVDIGANTVTVSIFQGEGLLYSRQQPAGGNQLTNDIASHFGMEFEQAEIAKLEGNLGDDYVPNVLTPFMENMGLEVSRALQFFFASTSFGRIDLILLAGGCAILPGLDEVIGTRTQIPAQVANPFARAQIGNGINVSSLKVDAPSLVTACGLALRRFDPS